MIDRKVGVKYYYQITVINVIVAFFFPAPSLKNNLLKN